MIITNHEKGYALFNTLVKACVAKQFPYDHAEVPQLPKNLPQAMPLGGLEHALYLFHVCYYMRGGIQSGSAIKSMTRVWNYNRRFFEYDYANSEDAFEDIIVRVLESNGLGFSKTTIPRFWKSNLLKLGTFWEQDPRTFFKYSRDYKELCDYVIGPKVRKASSPVGFYSFQHKMVSMITYFLVDGGIIEKPFPYPVPVDFHVLRILTAHQILVVRGDDNQDKNGYYSEKLLEAARELTMQYCIDTGIKETDLCNALWLFSNTLCNKHPGNRSIVSKERKGRSTEITPYSYNWTKNQVRRYEATCHRCAVKKTCAHHIPAADYYVRGKIFIRSAHQKPPQGLLEI